MKREIKFRAYRKSTQNICNVLSIDFEKEWVLLSDGDEEDISDLDLMQYTGLHDKNGREIYENDLLQCTSYTYGNGETGKTSLLVKYDEMSAGFIAGPYMLGKLMDIRKCEVIGNIFENPELLEGKQ
ncbi:YopX family protein [Lacticaseibacillus paracasei]|uniref:YopX protein domain-containing protein n=1 Tax=Lacticaseibacillus paracasei NRIC 0644 TaxID=1435038 RepID=A0A0C9Q759_LACPA|nr:YopX family protein [Lacticaseibacillus paracasei]GAN35657.1 hypothetical protein LC0644_0246 [Lacticaseibacillus paracasei NRIC 0644]GAN38884.1 hypothetical protein LC1917_0761 [Lacticaseibacillus paracasei NRIC 1917]